MKPRPLSDDPDLQVRVLMPEDPAYDFAPDIGTSPWNYRVIAPPQAALKPPARLRKVCRRHPRRCRLRPR